MNEADASPRSPDVLSARGLRDGLVATALIVPASLVMKADLPVAILLGVGVLLWLVAAAFWLNAIVFSVTAFRASKRLLIRTLVSIALPALATALIAVL